MNILQQIIVEEVKRHYPTEAAFYRDVLGISQPSWNRWKNSEYKMKDMSRIKSLFTSYEWMLANKVASDMAVYPNNFKADPYAIYTDCKIAIAKQWAGSAEISVNSAGNDIRDFYQEPGTLLTVTNKYDLPLINKNDTLRFYINCSSANVPAGKNNRLEWFQENFEQALI